MSRTPIVASLILLTAAILVSTPELSTQQTESARLDVALSKQSYSVDEAVVVTYRITNLSNSLICFPPPAVDCYSISGELAATATPPKGVSRPTVGGGCAACRFVDRDAGFDIDHHWIKLAPLQSYEIKRESHSIILMGAGGWLVDGGYVPMREDTQSLYQSALKERGCTLLPELHSPKVRVLVKTSIR